MSRKPNRNCPQAQDGMKFDKFKEKWALLPMSVMKGVVWVLTFGTIKYARDNWKKVDNAVTDYYSALQRHLESWWNDGDYEHGEAFDSEYSIQEGVGTHHLWHALCCLIFITWFEMQRLGHKAVWAFVADAQMIAAKIEKIKDQKLKEGKKR